MTTTNSVIFLDFDGPLIGETGEFSHSAILELNKLCHATGAAIVFITSLRYRFTITELQSMLLQNGFDATIPILGEVRDLSDWRSAVASGQWPSQKRWTKAEEIAAFLEAHPDIERFVIIDDDDARKFENYEVFVISPCGVFSVKDRQQAVSLLASS